MPSQNSASQGQLDSVVARSSPSRSTRSSRLTAQLTYRPPTVIAAPSVQLATSVRKLPTSSAPSSTASQPSEAASSTSPQLSAEAICPIGSAPAAYS